MKWKLLLAALAVCLPVAAQMRMTVEQLAGFIRSSVKLGHPDKQVADYLEKVQLTQRLDASTVEDLQGAGAGPKTMEALRELEEASKTLPAAPPKPRKVEVVATIAPPPRADQEKVLAEVRDYANNYVRQLPDFICVQVTRRYVDPSGLEFWQNVDTVMAQLSFFERKEQYKVVMVNNRSMDTDMHRIGGATSTGEFGSMLKEIFEDKTQALFQWERWATLRGRRMHVFSYRVPQSRSEWSIRYERSQQITPAYRGLVYVDRDSRMVMRVTLEATDLPPSFPIQAASQVLDYDFTKIADREYLLPLKSVMRMREGKFLVKNETEFRMYRKFGAEATITTIDFDNLPPLPETQEQPATTPKQ
jgi:hypothetical protein